VYQLCCQRTNWTRDRPVRNHCCRKTRYLILRCSPLFSPLYWAEVNLSTRHRLHCCVFLSLPVLSLATKSVIKTYNLLTSSTQNTVTFGDVLRTILFNNINVSVDIDVIVNTNINVNIKINSNINMNNINNNSICIRIDEYF